MKKCLLLILLAGFATNWICAQQLSAEMSVLIERGNDIIPQAKKAGEEAYAELCIKYYVPKSQRQHLTRLLEEREMRKLTYNYIHPNSAYKRVCSRMAVDSVFQDSIDMVLIPYNKNISGENISYVLRTIKAYNLDEAQSKYLKHQALDLAHQLHRNPRANVWKQEMKALRSTMTEKQLECFFALKNGSRIGKKLKEDWIKLTEAGQTSDLDSISDRAKASRYYMSQYKIMDLYKYENSVRKKQLEELSKQMPLWVKKVDALEKRKRIDERKKEVSKDYVW